MLNPKKKKIKYFRKDMYHDVGTTAVSYLYTVGTVIAFT